MLRHSKSSVFFSRTSLCPFLYPSSCQPFSSACILLDHGHKPKYKRPKRDDDRGTRRATRSEMSRVPASIIPHDFGLLEGTLIMPTGNRKPSFLTMPAIRIRLEAFRAWKRIKDVFRFQYGWKYSCEMKATKPKNSILPKIMRKLFRRKPSRSSRSKIRPRLRLWSAVTDGLNLHRQMYQRVTGNDSRDVRSKEEDMETIRQLCAEGLRDQLVPLIRSRRQDQSATWEIKGVWPHVTSRVVSNQVSSLPRDNSAIRQTIVKIRSQQRVLRYDYSLTGEKQLINGTDQWNPVTEYLVIQKRILDGVEENWRIWGVAEESSYEEVLGIEPVALADKSVIN